jgi:transcriptional regulatory protein LevR/transcriptional regulator with AAA-type ATPase domain
MKNENLIVDYIYKVCMMQKEKDMKVIGCSTNDIADNFKLQRSNVSSILNKNYKNGNLLKIKGKPTMFIHNFKKEENEKNLFETSNFDMLIGSNGSLKRSIQQAKAAILYPPHGLHSLILGATGVGKTMFAELMHKFSIENGIFNPDTPFVSFNCADYYNNPQLLLAHLFGSKKGSFTGADKDKLGIVEKANGGILFLDEVHRLPPEGQEMLFSIIDKGMYTPLGETTAKKKVDILIICATTEDKDSSLLETFTRRIPILVTIPSLKDRPINERFDLTSEFFSMEAKRIGKEIVVTSDAIISLLLYNCNGNIGQLKSDIQLGCANSFLKCLSNGEKKIKVHSTDYSENVRKGILNYNKYKDELNKIIKNDSLLSFTSKGIKNFIEVGNYVLPNNFYDDIEKRVQELRSRGIDDKDINMIMSFDIENYFRKYIHRIDKEVNKEELLKVVDNKIISLVERYLEFASEKLNIIFSSKVFYGLCMHLSSSIERLKSNKPIINYNLAEVIEKYPDEYSIALRFSSIIENEENIRIPVDEVSYMAMFLGEDKIDVQNNEAKPIVVVAMHGRNTASSMVEVVNRLIGGDNIYAYDMNLDKNTNVAYEELKELIIQNNRGAGVLLLVDMGSLGMFGELISEEAKIKIRVIDMVSTPIALECARKAVMEKNIDVIYETIKNRESDIVSFGTSMFQDFNSKKENLIITVCTTGEGSAVKLKNMIEQNINIKNKNIQVVPMAIDNHETLSNKINKMIKSKKIIAIVGTINPNIYGIPYISVAELFLDRNYDKINELVCRINSKEGNITKDYTRSELCNLVFDTLNEEINSYDVSEFKALFSIFIENIESKLKCTFNKDTLVGLLIHMVCALSRIIKGEDNITCSNKNKIMKDNLIEFEVIKDALFKIEDYFKVKITEDEICYLIMILKNS